MRFETASFSSKRHLELHFCTVLYDKSVRTVTKATKSVFEGMICMIANQRMGINLCNENKSKC